MRNDLKKTVESCTACQHFNIVKEGYHPLQSVEADTTWDHIEIDLIGPVPESSSGFNYILTVVDVLTSFVVIRALKTKEKESIAKALWEIFADFGTPRILQSDNGTEFVNSVVKQLATLYGIDHRLITAYNPRANGAVERKNKGVSRQLKKMTAGAKDKWQDWLPMIQLALNVNFQQRTGTEPFSIFFGRRFNEFKDFQHCATAKDLWVAMQKRLETLEKLRAVVMPAIVERSRTVRKEKSKAFHKSNKMLDKLVPGTRVMLIDPIRQSKWDPIYEGPFTVVRQMEGQSYVLRDQQGEELPRRATIHMLKVLPEVDTSVPVKGERQHEENLEKGGDTFVVDFIRGARLDEDNSGYQYLVH